MAFSQNGENTWNTLSKVEIEKRFDETLNFEVDYPTFSEEVKKLNVQIVGKSFKQISNVSCL